MKKNLTSLRSGSLFFVALLTISLIALAAAEHFRAAATFTLPNFSKHSMTTAAMMQAGANCTGFGFSYGRGFAPDPATQERPISVVSADFNKDGKTDLVASNLFGNSISVLLGDGTGGFGIATNIPVVGDGRGAPAGLAVGDFDGDTNLDLAIAIEYNPGRVFVMNGNGAGNFTVSHMLDAGVVTTAVAVADFNADSKPDLAAVNKGDTATALPGTVSVFLNNGSGGFGAPTTLTPGTTPVALAVGEFTGDAQPDIAVVNNASNNISLFANTSGGTFAAATNFGVGTNPSGIVAGFFNNDTRLDLAVANTGSDNVSILFANGSGGFGAATNFAGGPTPYGIITNDFNADGKADLGISNGFANQASVILNNGSGGFGAPQTTAVGSQPLSLASGDFNTDAKADLAVANSASNNITILLGKGNGTFGGTTFLFSNPQAVAIEDFNQDGRADFAVANFGGDKITVFLADSSGGYSVPNEFDVGIKPISMTSGDFNADGNADLAVANNGSANASILLGNGAGGFASATNFTTGSQPASIASGDFNKDGKLDLATANDAGNNVSLLLGQGDGTFATTGSFGAGTRPTSIDVDDFNGDSNLDLAVANLDSTFVTILLGSGSGTFLAAPNLTLPGGGKGRSVTTNDLNNDGKTDVVIALHASNQLAIALGNGNGTFAAPSSINAGGTNPSEVIVNDFDGDAKADLAVTNSANDFISLLRGNGDGTFAAAKTFPTGAGPVSLADGDLNNDQRVDLAVVSSTANSLTLLLNTCANTPPRITPAPALMRTQGGTPINSVIATVSDLETAAGNLSVSAFPPAVVTFSDVTNTNGTITANISTECATLPGDKIVTLEVVDANGLSTLATITVTVTANTAPVLGAYTGLEIVSGTSRSFTPSAAPNDNGTITIITAASTPAGFTGTFSVNPTTGVLTVNNAGPAGTYDVTLTATDNCGLTATRNAQLKVVAPLVIASLDPATKQAQSGEFTLMVNGSGFTANSKVLWNGSERATTFVSATKLSATIPAADINLNAASSANISVSDPAAGGLTSNTVAFTITAPNPVPAITTLNPASAIAGDAGFLLTVNGSNFLSNSVVKFNGADRTTTFVSATQLTINVTAADLANPGSATITVFNPTPGGGTSNSVSLPINNPAPGAITLSPNATIVGSGATLLTVNGTGFRPDSMIRVNGIDRMTTVASATQVTTQLTVADLAMAGTLSIRVNTPPPGGGLSPEANFTVNNPAPVLTALDPGGALAGGAAFTLKINGTGFVTGSQVKFNGADRATTFVSATQLTIAVTAAEIANTGSITIAVVNPTPGGGTSNQLTLPINNPAPTLTNLNPNTVLVGSAATLVTLTGTGFRPNSIVKVNGADRATTFVSATQVTTMLTVADLASAGTLKLSVFTATPGGGTSTEVNFTVGNPAPTLTSLNPTTATTGGAAFLLTVNGTGFVAGTVVKFNNTDRAATIVNGTQLTIAITAADIATAGSAKITVFNPAPAGGTSNELTLSINNPAPIATSVDKPTITAGTGASVLTITGTGFRPDSVARVNGANRVTTFVSATELKVALLSSDVASGGTLKLTVFTPTPGGGTSAELNVTVNNPAPTVTSLSPNAAFAGDPAFVLTVTGTNFVPTSVVRWNGIARVTTFVSATQLTAAIPNTDLATDGAFDVTVFNPTPGGGTSSAVKFTVNPLTGFEADLTPRPKGDNRVSIADWVLVGRMASGLDSTNDSSEFQRADSAPLATFGDGRITIADWVQAGRFAAGLDPLTPAQGPSLPASSLQTEALAAQAAAFAEAQPELTRVVRARSVEFVRGELSALPIELEAQGNENGVSFSLNYDARQLLFSHAVAPEGWSVNVKSEPSGRLGVMLAKSAGMTAQFGKQPIVTVYFASLGGTETVTTDITFDDQVFARDIADVKAALLPKATYEKAAITIKGRGIANVRAASYVGPDVTSDSIASAFGVDLATEAAGAVSTPLPETLAGTRVQVTDSKGVTRAASLFFVSPTQVNYLLPSGMAEGLASVTITNRNGLASRGNVQINAVAPSVFSADSTGKGVAAADVVRVRSDGKQFWERASRFDPATNQVIAQPIDLGAERGPDSDKVYLILYGTGIRGRAELTQVKVKLGDVYVQAEYAGKQGGFAGLDQINALIPRQLIGRGEVNVELIVNGQAANTVKVQIR
jgi:uncharacterized protein (TIGR03437 family)